MVSPVTSLSQIQVLLFHPVILVLHCFVIVCGQARQNLVQNLCMVKSEKNDLFRAELQIRRADRDTSEKIFLISTVFLRL